MYSLRFDPEICKACETCDGLMKCQYISFSLVDGKTRNILMMKRLISTDFH